MTFFNKRVSYYTCLHPIEMYKLNDLNVKRINRPTFKP